MGDNREIGTTRSGLRLGWTTGSCAAGAAKAAARMLFAGESVEQVCLTTPKGIRLTLDVEEISRHSDRVRCAVRKYSGDDPDVTDGMAVYACVERVPDMPEEGPAPDRAFLEIPEKESPHGRLRIILDGGCGVGRVRKRGLEQKVGQPAINRVPRRMITEEVAQICREYGYSGTIKVTVSIPGGEETAKRTFNPRLGIEGGLSVLGTSGIVEPMSEKALTDTIWLEMKMLRGKGYRSCYAVPGNYGMDFLRERLGLSPELAVTCSNYMGETIDDGVLLGMKSILLVGHVGKFIKLAAGVMDTHSRQADCRMEIFAAHAAMAGADAGTARALMSCINTAQAVRILKENNLLETVMESVMERIAFYLHQRGGEGMRVEAIVFSEEEGILGQTARAGELLEMTEGQKNGG